MRDGTLPRAASSSVLHRSCPGRSPSWKGAFAGNRYWSYRVLCLLSIFHNLVHISAPESESESGTVFQGRICCCHRILDPGSSVNNSLCRLKGQVAASAGGLVTPPSRADTGQRQVGAFGGDRVRDELVLSQPPDGDGQDGRGGGGGSFLRPLLC